MKLKIEYNGGDLERYKAEEKLFRQLTFLGFDYEVLIDETRKI
jgi:hypothetical protein